MVSIHIIFRLKNTWHKPLFLITGYECGKWGLTLPWNPPKSLCARLEEEKALLVSAFQPLLSALSFLHPLCSLPLEKKSPIKTDLYFHHKSWSVCGDSIIFSAIPSKLECSQTFHDITATQPPTARGFRHPHAYNPTPPQISPYNIKKKHLWPHMVTLFHSVHDNRPLPLLCIFSVTCQIAKQNKTKFRSYSNSQLLPWSRKPEEL